MTLAQIKLLAYALIVLALIGVGWKCASDRADFSQVKAEVRSYKKAATETKRSVEISKDTAARVDKESEDTRQRTARAVETIDAHITRDPVVAGPADPDLMRIAREAHSRAARAHCRVQRAGNCADTTAAP